jgi:hypothetical protein
MSSSTEVSSKLDETREKPLRHQSRVSADHFDPDGAQALSQTLSSDSAQQRSSEQTRPPSQRSDPSTAQSLTIGESVDFEKLVRRYIERYVLFPFAQYRAHSLTITDEMNLASRVANSVSCFQTCGSWAWALLQASSPRLDPFSTPGTCFEGCK